MLFQPQKKKKKTSKGKEKSPKKEPSKPSSSNGEVMIQVWVNIILCVFNVRRGREMFDDPTRPRD